MKKEGLTIYDQKDFFDNYFARRNRPDSPNEAIEGPILIDLLGDLSGKSVLDLGCGDASFSKHIFSKGADLYTGVEQSKQMLEASHASLITSNTKIIESTMEAYHYPPNTYDVVTSRMAIHYVQDVEVLFRKIYETLKHKGEFIFSIQHPLTTSSFLSKEAGEKRGNWIVDNYFEDGLRKEPWLNEIVEKYHRTIEQYFTALVQAGFTVRALKEGMPVRENFTSDSEYKRRKRIPIILIFACTK